MWKGPRIHGAVLSPEKHSAMACDGTGIETGPLVPCMKVVAETAILFLLDPHHEA